MIKTKCLDDKHNCSFKKILYNNKYNASDYNNRNLNFHLNNEILTTFHEIINIININVTVNNTCL